ncbi:hypothetical protein [Aromatoleum aromaticum]|uniref:hypothetical protein n=1 Tax=Aromatoleum aromaticum TaxID=551760 RepID=UPI001459D51B|nr:hypothetical protein [Aromatoleum aromaticum]NMG56194.1 hypothetical protein [Aromatoleum aromaticum]
MSDITKFCNTNDPRSFMARPVRRNGFLYATNGHVAVRMIDDPTVDDVECDATGPAVKMLDGFSPAEFTWHPIPEIRGARPCFMCSGSGRAKPCTDCDGEGEFDHGRHTYRCQECGGSGEVGASASDGMCDCDHCAGTGIDPYEGLDVGIAHYAKRYLKLIGETFPGAELGVPSGELSVAMWRCGDVIGALSPMRRPQ